MNNKTTSLFIFIMGIAIGSAATRSFVKRKYEKIAQDEIDSVKEVFSKREPGVVNDYHNTDISDVRMKAEQAKEKPNIVHYAAKLRQEGYTNYSDSEVKEENRSMNKPYIIAPESFGDLDDYETISITYYADQILADDKDELIEDVENVVGLDSLNHFGEYEDDSVFVRNDRMKCDYEILLDQRKYSEVVKKPHQMEE